MATKKKEKDEEDSEEADEDIALAKANCKLNEELKKFQALPNNKLQKSGSANSLTC